MVHATPPRQKITFGEMRASGVRGLLIYCSDYHCSLFRFPLAQKSPGGAGAFELSGGKCGSVFRDNRAAKTAKAVVHAHGDHIHVLSDPIERTGKEGIRYRERIVCAAHEKVVVFKTDRPVRCKG